LQQSQPSRP